jgi:hypothetical protein
LVPTVAGSISSSSTVPTTKRLLKYRITRDPELDREKHYVEYWINNRLGFIFASCRFIDGDKTTDWSSDGHHDFGSDSIYGGFPAYCGITSVLGIGSRDVWFSFRPSDVRPPE